MKQSEFVKWLRKQGATFVEATKHTKIYLGDKRSTIGRHGSEEMKTGTVEAIKKQLGLK